MFTLPTNAFDRLQNTMLRYLEESFEEDEACQLAEESLYEFIKYTWSALEPTQPYCDAWHVKVICEHLEAVSRFEIKNLLINIPPRHAKSLITAVAWPAWLWLKHPGRKFLFTSYSESLSHRDSRRCRSLINNPFYQLRWGNRFSFCGDNNQVKKFENTRGGCRIATSTTGLGTGEGADHIVADDPNKVGDANSKAAMERTQSYWDDTLASRYNNINEFTRVVIMQRISESDLSGHIILQHRSNYEHLCLPAEYEPKRFFEVGPYQIIPTKLQQAKPYLQDNEHGSGRRETGDPLWPERMDTNALNILKCTLSSVGIAGQLQQRPTPGTGVIFEKVNFKYCSFVQNEVRCVQSQRSLGHFDKLWFFQVADTAQKATDTACWTVVGTFGLSPQGDLIVYHIYRERLEVPDQLGFLVAASKGAGRWDRTQRKWAINPENSPWPFIVQCQFVEEKSSGIGLLQDAVRAGLSMRSLKPNGDKLQRCTQIVTQLTNGKVYFPGDTSWLSAFEAELISFPHGTFDDQVDVFSYAGQVASSNHNQRSKLLQGDFKTVAERLGL